MVLCRLQSRRHRASQQTSNKRLVSYWRVVSAIAAGIIILSFVPSLVKTVLELGSWIILKSDYPPNEP